MNEMEILTVRRLPGRLTAAQTAILLGIAGYDIQVLVRARLLKPLGNPAKNAPKWFCGQQIDKLRTDEEFLNRIARALQKHWRNKNTKKPEGDDS